MPAGVPVSNLAGAFKAGKARAALLPVPSDLRRSAPKKFAHQILQVIIASLAPR